MDNDTSKEITPDCEQIRLMSHALGIPNAKTYNRHGKKYIKSYRNYYQPNVNPKRSVDCKWNELIKNGYAEKEVIEEKYIYYFVSDKGISYMEEHLGAIIKEQK